MGDKIATRQSYGQELVALGKENNDIVVLDADLSGSTMTKDFAKAYPDRFFNIGIAEANMYGVAAGLAVSGKTVFASTFAIFAAGRAYEIIRNAIGYTKANVKICATHAGLTVGEDGASHQAIEDLALMSVIPGMTVLNPADDISAKKLLQLAAAYKGPVYVRLGRAAVPVIYDENTPMEIGKALTVREGQDYTIIATGIMVSEALAAAESLALEGVDVRVIDMHTIKPIDREAIIKAACETSGIVTAEEHSIIGGLGACVAQVCCEQSPANMAFVGVKDTFGESGTPGELLKKYGLTAADIALAVKSLIK
ncbi:MAG: transketolase family protein [Clostridia bacterium]|nr:transketolase family protein [Clostridia bacterium]